MNARRQPLERLVRPETLARALACAGTLAQSDGIPVADCAWPRGRNGYILRLRGRDGNWWGAADFGDDDVPANVLAGRARGEVWPLTPTGGLIWHLASDPALAVRRALRPVTSQSLAADGVEIAPGQAPEVLSYKPLQRSMLRWPGSGAAALFVKLYGGERDEQAAVAYGGLRHLHAPPGITVTVLHPQRRIRRWRALVWEETAGETLHARLGASLADGAAALAGTALACLHAGAADWLKARRIEDELAGLESWARLAVRVWPGLQDPLLFNLDELLRRSRALGPGRSVPSHRDFHDKQVLVNGASAAILDLDMACLADAELDVGNLLAHLRLRVRQGWAASDRTARNAFLGAYRQVNADVDPERIAFYEACARLRLACVYALRPRWAWLVPHLVRDASGGAANAQSEERSS